MKAIEHCKLAASNTGTSVPQHILNESDGRKRKFFSLDWLLRQELCQQRSGSASTLISYESSDGGSISCRGKNIYIRDEFHIHYGAHSLSNFTGRPTVSSSSMQSLNTSN